MSNRTIDLAIEINKVMALAESGEIPAEAIADTLEGLEGMIEDKFDATISVIREFESKQDACKKEAARITERSKHWQRQARDLKQYLLECLQATGRQQLKTTLNTFSIRKGSFSLTIDDVDQLPDEFVESRTEIINDVKNDEIKKILTEAFKIVEDLKAKGEPIPEELLNKVPGAHVERGEDSLAIR